MEAKVLKFYYDSRMPPFNLHMKCKGLFVTQNIGSGKKKNLARRSQYAIADLRCTPHPQK